MRDAPVRPLLRRRGRRLRLGRDRTRSGDVWKLDQKRQRPADDRAPRPGREPLLRRRRALGDARRARARRSASIRRRTRSATYDARPLRDRRRRRRRARSPPVYGEASGTPPPLSGRRRLDRPEGRGALRQRRRDRSRVHAARPGTHRSDAVPLRNLRPAPQLSGHRWATPGGGSSPTSPRELPRGLRQRSHVTRSAIRKGFGFSPPSHEEVTAESFRHAHRARPLASKLFDYVVSAALNIVGVVSSTAPAMTAHISGLSARDGELRRPAPQAGS